MNLKTIRLQSGMTQREVANAVQCSTTVYSRYERGEREPSIETLLKLSSLFEVSVDYLLGNDPAWSKLSKYETDLIKAFRGADDRAKEDALNILLAHEVNKNKEKQK